MTRGREERGESKGQKDLGGRKVWVRENLGKPAMMVGKHWDQEARFPTLQQSLITRATPSFCISEKCELELVPPRRLPALTFYESISQSMFTRVSHLQELPWWLIGKESTCQRRSHRFDPWVGKIPWRRAWQPTPVFLPRESYGQRSLTGYSPWGHKELGTTT